MGDVPRSEPFDQVVRDCVVRDGRPPLTLAVLNRMMREVFDEPTRYVLVVKPEDEASAREAVAQATLPPGVELDVAASKYLPDLGEHRALLMRDPQDQTFPFRIEERP